MDYEMRMCGKCHRKDLHVCVQKGIFWIWLCVTCTAKAEFNRLVTAQSARG